MKKEKLISVVVMAFIVGVFGFLFLQNKELNWSKKISCVELGESYRENKREVRHFNLKINGELDNESLSYYEYIYNKKLDTCLYYRQNIIEEIQTSYKRIIDLTTNQEILYSTVISINNKKEKLEFCSSSIGWKCENREDFDEIKKKLFNE